MDESLKTAERTNHSELLRQPVEIRFAEELETLAKSDTGTKPPGWNLSPRAVRTFILGSDSAQGKVKKNDGSAELKIGKKFHGEPAMIDRAIVSLMSNRGLLLVGEPGTAKSMLSELLAAAISGSSNLTIQGTAGTTEDQIKYSWNYALLLAEGPTRKALVPAPLYHGLEHGKIVRFEEITRCPPEIQDTMISVLSDKVLNIPELKESENILFAKPGFNVIATANTRDRGVHEMSAALKRRFNFETVPAIADKHFELDLVLEQAKELLHNANAAAIVERDVLDVLVTTFIELRKGRTEEGTVVDKPSTTMSTAEAVAVAFAAGLDACYFSSDGRLKGEHLAKQIVGTVLKDSDEDAKKVRQYFDIVVKSRAKKNEHWKSFYDGRGILG
ncbi:MAG: AAA family ATPase [Candidatus Obscuribacterales bacterium]|nr:AAA family ATPase [Cyanobacteria bacterium SZAS LIN-5]RTL43698.1 MAG: AAA family ATPase [Candidatus Melainabacteria bacterium]